MMSSRLPLLSAVLALLFFASADPNLPSPLRNVSSLGLINEDDQAPPARQLQNLTFRKWPPRPYRIPLPPIPGSPYLEINLVLPFQSESSVRVAQMQEFLQDFRDNLAHEYPVPGYIPHKAQQSIFDLDSYTWWTIGVDEGFFGRRGLTEWALLALDKLVAQLGAYGPADVTFVVFAARSRLPYIHGGLTIDTVGDLRSPLSLANRTGSLQTS